MKNTLLLLLLLLAAAGCNTTTDTAFDSAFPEATPRIWTGGDYYANRLQDWRLEDGRLLCVEGRPARPMRTLHLLTRTLTENPGTLSMSVRTGPATPGGTTHENTWTGFLLGAGGAEVDHRISALVHHWPGEDGGLIVALDGNGRLVVRDNSRREGPSGPGANYPADTWPLLEPSTSETTPASPPGDVVLRLDAEPTGDTYRLTVSAEDYATGTPAGRAVYEDIPAEHLTGNVALVSHNSPQMEGPGYWFRDWRVAGSKLQRHDDRAFGPVMGTQYTLSRQTLKLTAQMGPLGTQDARTATLEIQRNGRWETAATGTLTDMSYTVPFRVENWTADADTPYRVVYPLRTGEGTTQTTTYEGVIRRPPDDSDPFVLAALNCNNISAGRDLEWNHSRIWHPHNELVAAVRHHQPDLLFFAGDQIYEGGLEGIVRTPPDLAALDYLYHWYRWVWAFRDLTRDTPTVTIPDDHDVYHGNIWGAGGIKAEGPLRPFSDNGGYGMDAAWVNAVHRTQVSHLPDPFDPTPIEQDISVYYTDLTYGGVSFAVIADRMWKSPPRKLLPEGDVWNGWFQNPDYDPVTEADVPAAVLLGDRQLSFLEQWSHDWAGGTWMKVMLSQTLFSNLATIPEEATSGAVIPGLPYVEPGTYVAGDKKAADTDSNGWPQTGRNKALRTIRQGFAYHVAGDQHLGSLIRYGVDDFNDAGFAFVVPSIANIWPRRWFPPTPGANRKPDSPPYTGDHFDGFGNRMTVHAVANPVRSGREPAQLYDRVPGYGIIRFDRAARTVTAEAWPRWVDPAASDAAQYFGWPVTVTQQDNGRPGVAHLPALDIQGMTDPVVQVIREDTGEPLYTLRIRGSRFRPHVFDASATYTVQVGEPGTDRLQTLTGLTPAPEGAGLTVTF